MVWTRLALSARVPCSAVFSSPPAARLPAPLVASPSAAAAALRPAFVRSRPPSASVRRTMSTAPPPPPQPPTPPRIVASSEAEAEAVRAALQRLLPSSPASSSGPPGRWSLTATGDGVERSFRFKNFTKTWDFMTAVALQCKLKNHHPEWSNVYNTTFVRWTTHNPHGLTRKDVEMAAVCDDLARDFGEVVEATPTENAASAAPACGLAGLANSAASAAGGSCCIPSKGETNKAP
ncbi:pterin-4-alpha-carbinolamine dehydratase [Niveomyces insectorum RCEF 264]|uniref:4a-hydroxytetrahydrobiopterin dehydratase n=1 Tax=Niveomyces insectorum RCEF 264 TaxID=1081102 RepID=A0A167WW74_9HYPO|nr:pterin-4-alpha-carbinolamine dehydratase [Niveomyces insectorum RCEF 264]